MAKLLYEPLDDDARNEIRLLQPAYDKKEGHSSCMGADLDSPSPRFLRKTVSLDDFTGEGKATDMIPSRDHKLWADS